jgi:hypothetical protein
MADNRMIARFLAAWGLVMMRDVPPDFLWSVVMLAVVFVRFAKRSADRLSFYATLLRLLISVARKGYRPDYLGRSKAQIRSTVYPSG